MCECKDAWTDWCWANYIFHLYTIFLGKGLGVSFGIPLVSNFIFPVVDHELHGHDSPLTIVLDAKSVWSVCLCYLQVDQVLRVERLRQAVMENLKFEFAKPFLPTAALYAGYPMPYGQAPGGPFPFRPAGMGRMPPQAQGGPGMNWNMGQMGPHDMGPPPQGRGRGILGKYFSHVK